MRGREESYLFFPRTIEKNGKNAQDSRRKMGSEGVCFVAEVEGCKKRGEGRSPNALHQPEKGE